MCIKIVISTFAIVIDLKKRNYKYIFTLNQSNLTRCTLRKCSSISCQFDWFSFVEWYRRWRHSSPLGVQDRSWRNIHLEFDDIEFRWRLYDNLDLTRLTITRRVKHRTQIEECFWIRCIDISMQTYMRISLVCGIPMTIHVNWQL